MIKSTIVNYEQFAYMWVLLPNPLRIRIPKTVFTASVDGYNLITLYNKCREYVKSYCSCVILI